MPQENIKMRYTGPVPDEENGNLILRDMANLDETYNLTFCWEKNKKSISTDYWIKNNYVRDFDDTLVLQFKSENIKYFQSDLDIKYVDNYGRTALHNAVLDGDEVALRCRLVATAIAQNMADIGTRDIFDKTAVDYLILFKQYAFIDVLINEGINHEKFKTINMILLNWNVKKDISKASKYFRNLTDNKEFFRLLNTAFNTQNYYGVFTLVKLTAGWLTYKHLGKMGVCSMPHNDHQSTRPSAPRCSSCDNSIVAAPPDVKCTFTTGNPDEFALTSLIVGNDRLTKILFRIKGWNELFKSLASHKRLMEAMVLYKSNVLKDILDRCSDYSVDQYEFLMISQVRLTYCLPNSCCSSSYSPSPAATALPCSTPPLKDFKSFFTYPVEKYSVLNTLIDNNKHELMKHHLFCNYLNHKWNQYGRFIYLLNLFLNALFLILISFNSSSIGKLENYVFLSHMALYSCIFLLVVLYIREYFKIKNQRKLYLNFYSFIRASMLVACAVFTFELMMSSIYEKSLQTRYRIDNNKEYLKDKSNFFNTHAVYQPSYVYANNYNTFVRCDEVVLIRSAWISTLLTWIDFILYLRRISFFSLYLQMLSKVLVDIILALSVYSLFLVAFANVFSIITDNTDYINMFFNLIIMTSGDVNDDLLKKKQCIAGGSWDLHILFLCLIILLPIVIMNLMVGIAVGDIQLTRDRAIFDSQILMIEYIFGLEGTLFSRIVSALKNCCCGTCSKRGDTNKIHEGRNSVLKRSKNKSFSDQNSLYINRTRINQTSEDVKSDDTLKSAMEYQLAEIGRVADKIDCRGLEHRRDTELYAHCESIRKRRQMTCQQRDFDKLNSRVQRLTDNVDGAVKAIHDLAQAIKSK